MDIPSIKSNLELALLLAGLGWQIFPCNFDKTPRTPHGMKDSTRDQARIKAWWKSFPDALIGIACKPSGIFALDIDCKNGIDGWRSWAELVNAYGSGKDVSCGPAQQTPSGGAHLIFKYPPGIKVPNNAGKLGAGLDLRSDGYICTGGDYKWLDQHAPGSTLTEAPPWLIECIQRLTERPGRAPAKTEASTDAGNFWLRYYLKRAIPGNRNQSGFDLACQLRDSGLAEQQASTIMINYASLVPDKPGDPYTEQQALATMRSAYSSPARKPAILPSVINSNGHEHPDETAAPKTESTSAAGDEYLPLETIKNNLLIDETGDADLFVELFTDQLVYDHSESRWYLWAGNYWQPDETREVYNLITKSVAPQYFHAAAQAQKEGNDKLANDLAKRAAALRNKKRADNVLFLAANNPALALTGKEWDQDPWIIGLNNGVVELKDGTFRPGRPGDYIRAHSPIDWQGLDAPAERWNRFIGEVFSQDIDMVRFIQKLLGYGITGLTVEHILPILYGDGRNGKSTLLETLGDVLGKDLATSTQADTLMDTKKTGEGPQPFVYELRGKRLVWATESNEGRRINAGLAKQLTGGDRLHVRTLNAKPVMFMPTHLVMLLTNHRPHIPTDDQAIWDRVAPIPFEVRFVANPKGNNELIIDKHLKKKLFQEAPGILAWLVQGCLGWQKEGLNPPDAVNKATEAYREEEDLLIQFIQETCVIHQEAKIKASSFYQLYRTWCKDNGMTEMTSTTFGRRMGKKFEKLLNNGIWYLGVGAIAKDTE